MAHMGRVICCMTIFIVSNSNPRIKAPVSAIFACRASRLPVNCPNMAGLSTFGCDFGASRELWVSFDMVIEDNDVVGKDKEQTRRKPCLAAYIVTR